MTFSDAAWLNALNLALGLAAFSWLLFSVVRRRSEYPAEVRLVYALPILLLFALLVVSTQRLLLGEGVYFDAVVISLVKVSVLVILWRTRHTLFRTGTRHDGAEGGADQGMRNRDSDNPDEGIDAQ